jgi:hypothetical protein
MAAVTTNGDGAGAPRDEPTDDHEDEVASPPPSSEGAGATGAPAHACNVAFCPIGLAISAVQPLRPDAVEHLLLAGRELFLAMRTIVDARADQFGGPDDGATSFEKIDIG